MRISSIKKIYRGSLAGNSIKTFVTFTKQIHNKRAPLIQNNNVFFKVISYYTH